MASRALFTTKNSGGTIVSKAVQFLLGFLHASQLVNGFGFASYSVVAGSQITRAWHRETKLETFASYSLEEELLPPRG